MPPPKIRLLQKRFNSLKVKRILIIDLLARIVYGNAPNVEGDSMEEKRKVFMDKYHNEVKLLLEEPRGYPCQNVNVLYPRLVHVN